jgi:hypothetical protein
MTAYPSISFSLKVAANDQKVNAKVARLRGVDV